MMDKNSDAPLVSIGVPVRNGANYLQRAIDSITVSDYPHLEVVVCDNASTDDTEQIGRRAAAEDSRFRYYRNEENVGACGNFELAFQLSHGRYFRWLAHDDWCTPDYDSRLVAVLEADPSAVLAYTGQNVMDEDGTVTMTNCERIPGLDDPDAGRRLRSLAWSLRDPTAPVFGLMRTSALHRTQRIRNCPEPDRTLLYELCLYGGLRLVDAPLFYRHRPHGHLLHYGSGNPRRRSYEWLHPGNARRIQVSTLRVLDAQLASVRRSDLGSRDRARCASHLVASALVLRPRAKLRSVRRLRRLQHEARSGQLVDPGRQ